MHPCPNAHVLDLGDTDLAAGVLASAAKVGFFLSILIWEAPVHTDITSLVRGTPTGRRRPAERKRAGQGPCCHFVLFQPNGSRKQRGNPLPTPLDNSDRPGEKETLAWLSLCWRRSQVCLPLLGRGAQILMCYYCAESEQYLSLLTPSDVREELFT